MPKEDCPYGCSWPETAVCYRGVCCTPDCGNRECGSDGCGGFCGPNEHGSCGTGLSCKEAAFPRYCLKINLDVPENVGHCGTFPIRTRPDQ
jgi:hypothetical protein